MGQFGEKFRKEREKKNFSLDDVASVTKIGTRMLQAIEEEKFDRLPGGVFNKGFIRTYAKHLGMNDDKAVADYLACTRPTEDVPSTPVPSQNRAASPQKRATAPSKKNSPKQSAAKAQASSEVDELPDLQLPRTEHVRSPQKKYLDDRELNIPWGLLALAGVLVVLALFLWNRHSRNAHAQSAASPVKSSSLSAPPPAAAPATASYQIASAHSTTSNSAPASATQHLSGQTAAPHTQVAKPVAPGADDSAATANPSTATSAPLTLIIRAAENSWISVRADGQEVTAETLIAPAHTSVRAAREIVVKTGNAAGVNFLWNGKEVPAQGAEAEVRTIVFDADGVHTTPAAQPAIQNQ